MSEKSNILSLFDRSGNLTLNAMERYLRDELSQDERTLVDKHLAESDFDREALEGLQKHVPEGFRQEVEDLQADILSLAGKGEKTGSTRIFRKAYWYAAAGLAGLICLSVLMFFMFRSPVEKPQLAVAPQHDTIINSPPSAAGIRENGRNTETENTREVKTQKVFATTVKAEPEPSPGINEISQEPLKEAATQEIAEAEQPVIVADEIIDSDTDLIFEEQMVGGVAVAENKNFDKAISVGREQRTSSANPVRIQSEQFDGDNQMLANQSDTTQLFLVVEQMPEFPGGEEALYRFLNENIHYPDSAKTAGIQGRVFITFVVNTDGSISDVRILRGIGGGCDEEALRVVKSMPNWIPGTQHGKPVRVQYNLPVKFSLE
jgi:TonB family protein